MGFKFHHIDHDTETELFSFKTRSLFLKPSIRKETLFQVVNILPLFYLHSYNSAALKTKVSTYLRQILDN